MPLKRGENEANLSLKIRMKQMKIGYIQHISQLAMMNSCEKHVYYGRKSRPFDLRTVLPATRTSVTLADSSRAERNKSLVRPISKPWRR